MGYKPEARDENEVLQEANEALQEVQEVHEILKLQEVNERYRR